MSAGSTHHTPVELETRRRRRNRRLIILGVMLLLGLMSGSLYARNSDRPIGYDSELEHFKYGSIGSDRVPKGLPADVIAVLPQVFPQYLPAGAPHDYTAF